MGNLSEVLNEISDFRTSLATYLAIFGIGSILINAAVILFGLRPLDKVRQALADIREDARQSSTPRCLSKLHRSPVK